MTEHFSIRMVTFLTFLSFIYLGLHSFHGNHANASIDDFEREILDIGCPHVDICDPNATSAEIQPKGIIGFGFVSCCTSCSCHPECEKQKKCCFPKKNDSLSVSSEVKLFDCLSTQLVPLGKERRGDVPAYRTIVAEPPNGCVSTRPVKLGPGQTFSPTCDNSYLPIFGSFYPVYSTDTDLVYKNALCAICHGASKITPFVPLLICENREEHFALTEQMDVFVSGTLSQKCIISFRFGDPSLISKHRCYRDIVNTCELEEVKHVPYGYSGKQPLTIETVRSLCENGIFSPTPMSTKVYRNAFCLICATELIRPNDCRLDDTTGRNVFGSLTFIMDARKLKAQLNLPSERQRYPEVCLANDGQKVIERCRPLYCSSGKVRNANGDCEFITTSFRSEFLYVTLFLSQVGHEDNFYVVANETDVQGVLQAVKDGNPWPDSWLLKSLWGRPYKLNCNERQYEVKLVTRTKNLGKLYSEIETSIKMSWPIEMNGSMATYHQSWAIDETSRCGSNWQFYHSETFMGNSLNKLFLCPQVKLRSIEFKLEFSPVYEILYSNLTLRPLSESEFEIVHDEIRVCLADTIFSLPQTSDVLQIHSQIASIMVLLMIVTLARYTFTVVYCY